MLEFLILCTIVIVKWLKIQLEIDTSELTTLVEHVTFKTCMLQHASRFGSKLERFLSFIYEFERRRGDVRIL
jgi:hypothetical protein